MKVNGPGKIVRSKSAILKDRPVFNLGPFVSLILTAHLIHFDHDRPVWSTASDIIENAQKIVVVGDGMAGKTALLTRFVHPDTFTREYSPTIFENQSHFIEINNQQVRSHEKTILN